MYRSLLAELPAPEIQQEGWPWTEETDISVYDQNLDYPKISIVTPSFNQGIYIEETIRSILLQNYPNLELIVMDGGSTDKTRAILEKYDPWLTYWISEPDRGQTHALNKGVARCTGQVFNWLNSDDWYEAGFLQQIGAAFATGDEAIEVLCAKQKHHFTNGVVSEEENSHIDFDDLDKTIGCAKICQQSMFYSLKVIQKLGLSESFNYCMDLDLWVRYLLHYGLENVRKIDAGYAGFRFHEESKSENDMSKFELERSKIYQKIDSGKLKAKQTIDSKRILNYHYYDRTLLYYYKQEFKAMRVMRRKLNYQLLSWKEVRDILYVRRQLLLKHQQI